MTLVPYTGYLHRSLRLTEVVGKAKNLHYPRKHERCLHYWNVESKDLLKSCCLSTSPQKSFHLPVLLRLIYQVESYSIASLSCVSTYWGKSFTIGGNRSHKSYVLVTLLEKVSTVPYVPGRPFCPLLLDVWFYLDLMHPFWPFIFFNVKSNVSMILWIQLCWYSFSDESRFVSTI